MTFTRRNFLRSAAAGLGSAAFASTIQSFSLTNALAQGAGYKALVCVFMGGGNDSNNMLIPYDDSVGYQQYLAARNPAGLALTRGGGAAQLDATIITPNSIGARFALHPNTRVGFGPNPALHGLFNQGKVALVTNVGPLVRPLLNPTPRQAYLNNPSLRPLQLFSHSDQVQEWQTARADRQSPAGWGGMTADRFSAHVSGFPMVTSIAGLPLFSIGLSTRPLVAASAPTLLRDILVLGGFGTTPEEVARRNSFNTIQTTGRGNRLVAATGQVTEQALAIAAALGQANPTLTTTFPNTGLGNQLLQAARIIKANRDLSQLRLPRQIFFTSIGGFDTHQNQLGGQGGLLTQVSQAMGSFYAAMVELGLENDVTAFTLSDFNRTFNPAGSGGAVGSDHAWGSHHLIMGGSVYGGDFYGVPGPSGMVFQDLTMGGSSAYDTDTRGRWVPTTSVEQYAATLARWYGVSPADLNVVFPLLQHFSPSDLGFMA